MKTVLFIDKSAEGIWPSYLQLSYLLEGWRRKGLFAVCPWRPAARTVRTAVPALAGILGDEQEWDAVIVCDLRGAKSDMREDVHFDNPFDFPENYGSPLDSAVVESQRPLIRLCQMLGGLPDKVHLALGEDERMAFTFPQAATYYDLTDRYRTGLPRPRRILCVSPRSYDADLYRSRERELRLQGVEAVSDTGFWGRNDYPASARFVVFDWAIGQQDGGDQLSDSGLIAREAPVDPLAEQRATAYTWLRFWTGVLTLLTADLSSAELRPYRLYRIDPRLTPATVRKTLSSRWSEWVAACEQIEGQITIEDARLKRAESGDSELPDCSATVKVNFNMPRSLPSVGDARVTVLRDVPVPDTETWREHEQSVSTALRALLRAPRRALSRAVRDFQRESVFDEAALEYAVLTEDERLDLEDDLVEHEIALASSTGRRAFRMESHADAYDALGKQVVERIEERPQQDERVGAFGWVAAAMILGFAAFVPGVLGIEDAPRTIAAFASVVVLVPLILIVVLLLTQKVALLKAYEALDGWFLSLKAVLEAEALRLGQRLSRYASVRKGWSVVTRQDHLGEPTRYGTWLRERLAFMTSRMSAVSTAVGEPELDLDTLSYTRRIPWSHMAVRVADESFFDASIPHTCPRPLNGDAHDASTIEVPFEYVDSVELVALRAH